ncbi:MAG: TIGR01459 family HAD-type hydrolase [Rhizobiaceae bacterium]|nr:TIGR01459 family HAD-type hydrolase [Rhizobiaceae bacterium]
MSSPNPITGLSQIIDQYDCILCDVWGVLHNGKAIWSDAANALTKAREAGVPVVMITNAPRPQGPVLKQLANMNCPDGVFDELVTSGDVTRALIQQLDGPVYHIGPDRDYALYDGLDVEFASPENASGIVCTGLFDDYNEHPEEYVKRFKTYIGHKLPFICANPDIVVEVVDRLLWCAGALAREYDKLGGETRIVGKPYAPIYDVALEHAERIADKSIERSKVLAIGDGLPTDIKGAADNTVDALFITNGIHAADYTAGEVDTEKLHVFLEENKAAPQHWIKTLVW